MLSRRSWEMIRAALRAMLPTLRRCPNLITDVESAFGSLDILVNNAGLHANNIVMRLKDDDWDTVSTPTFAVHSLRYRAASRGMMKRRWGRIINITSVVGMIGNKGQSNYAASKAGSDRATKSIAKELASQKHSRERRCAGLYRDRE
jgi:3-oxoacyl-[acyl-carrier protein] reductase